MPPRKRVIVVMAAKAVDEQHTGRRFPGGTGDLEKL